MNKRLPAKVIISLLCLLLLGLIVWAIPRLIRQTPGIPGLKAAERVLLRIWLTDAPGGGQAWLTSQLRAFEKQHPGVMTYLRTVSAGELASPDAVLPDLILHMPGSLTDPQNIFLPLSGSIASQTSPIREELLRCGRWQTRQYGLPLCWGAWVLAIDSALEPGSAVTPAPTTLLGRPAATRSAAATDEPGYPLQAASQAECALQSPGGAALMTLGMLLEERPPLPEDFGTRPAAEVYASFRNRQCATAMLTTGQLAAFSALTSAGGGFPFRVMVSDEIVTDQIWLAGVTADAPQEAAMLLAHLVSPEAQKALSSQGLHTVRDDLTLYASGVSAQVEQAGQQALSAVSAYIPSAQVTQAAWQFFQQQLTLSEALVPLM